MKIQNIERTNVGSRSRVSADVIWEDCDRPAQKIYFEVDGQYTDALSCDPDSFVTVAILPALWHGEKRIALDADLCPDLRAGLITAMGVIHHWYQLPRPLVEIEAKPRAHGMVRPPERAAFFLTGGVDSLSTLRMNQLDFPKSNPGSFKDGILIFGLEVERTEDFQHVASWLGELAEKTGINLLPVYTNERSLDDDWNFWIDVFEGAVLAAVGHALSRRLTSVTIASSFDIPNLHCVASHPMLDPFYSSQGLRVRHDAAAISRFEKTRFLAEWDVGLQYIRVCNITDEYRADQLNCGRCEKCIRTMLALLAFGALERTRVFPKTELSADLIKEKVILHRKNFRFWPELVAPMEQIGRFDLADAIRYVCARYHGEIGWRGAIRRFDRARLNGGMSALKRAIWPNGTKNEPPRYTGAL
jgi:hypothetical protein